MKKIDNNKVKTFYEDILSVWPDSDNWHLQTKLNIEKFIEKQLYLIDKSKKILNAGSGGNCYGITRDMYHVDIARNKIDIYQNHYVESIEKMSFDNNFFDFAICVGSVINYCDAAQSISELSRIIEIGGFLLLEFESSWSFDFIGTKSYKSNACVIKTEYFDMDHYIWVYSFKYIAGLLEQYNLKPINTYRFHIISNLAYKFSKNLDKSANLIDLDSFFRYIPFFSNRSHNIMILCRKH